MAGSPRSARPHFALVVAASVVLCLVAAFEATVAVARADAPVADIAVQALPAQARATLDRIRSGGPFPYPRDGVKFLQRGAHPPRAAARVLS